jgi:hypothetical protein
MWAKGLVVLGWLNYFMAAYIELQGESSTDHLIIATLFILLGEVLQLKEGK